MKRQLFGSTSQRKWVCGAIQLTGVKWRANEDHTEEKCRTLLQRDKGWVEQANSASLEFVSNPGSGVNYCSRSAALPQLAGLREGCNVEGSSRPALYEY